ncbi:hypothetical protein DBR33_04500 [Stenotrophomonas sp. HMWF022]|uniref:hypothetical protein n=1 Tax=Stenotrophomonas sp. HMWF023 TaxID=2056859 RepID=UPI000D3A30E6|nr:hypothetical protein [Stenotrophomonas sp. HMWF023]PTS73001.1 hypothetical protein DBR20_16410 [Stenotrophomonas sp. HMWF023]PTT53880.1 hypothetical protein DBR33_04500 [Stenotrophomonas sp. HMWF022]
MRRLIWLAIGLLPGNALADDMVIYRCMGSSDVPTLQRTPCPAGTRQEIQRIPAPAPTVPVAPVQNSPAPPPAAMPSVDAAAETAATQPREGRTIMEARMVEDEGGDTILDSAMLHQRGDGAAADKDAPAKPPLPAIFQCVDTQGGSYLHEYEAAPGRCELLNVQGLGGATPVNAASCEVVSDRCTEVDEAQRCGSWQQRFRDARGRERFAAPENQQTARGERERLQVVLDASNCPVPQ